MTANRLLIFNIAIIFMLVLGACNKETSQRTAYLTMKNYNELECKKDPAADCPTQMEYEKYQKESEALYTPSGY